MPVSTLPPSWKHLADSLGGVAKLSAALGVNPTTLHRWAHGRSPVSGPGAILLGQLAGGDPPQPNT